MINSTDLRQGNLISLRFDNPGKVEEIRVNTAKCSYLRLDTLERSFALVCYSDLEGIPITEEWMLRLGFIKDLIDINDHNEGFYYSLQLGDNAYCDLVFLCGDKNGFLEVCLFPYEEYFRYHYVHEVQNLFYAITKKELEVLV